MFFRVYVFQGPGFSEPRFFRIQLIQGPGFLGSRFFRTQVQVLEVAVLFKQIFIFMILLWFFQDNE